MDKAARNAISTATQELRRLLEIDFAAQLDGTFDVWYAGTIAAEGGQHLSAGERVQREKIIAAVEHKQTAGMSAKAAVSDYVRDAAFTTLNRFAALKLLEARELVQECVSRGEESAGYREYCGLAPGVALLPNAGGYRLYVESLFDELSTEVKVLFDRRDPAAVLWPRRATFEALLEVLNGTELATVWGEDEAIGWIYQFFNSDSDRRAARYDANDKPKAPENSRELAVRNQFFTPRYVVQFLVDNTLGRLWQEMHGASALLAARCEYLVRPSDELIPTRAGKDPRDLRILDPACGSGHFLLYAFDLLLAIYEEAWEGTAGAVPSAETGRSLRDDYPTLDALRRAVPALIVEHNLYGVDIDPRAAQIAALALWLRARRAYRELNVLLAERPLIRRTHIVVAEPMTGDAALVEEFAAQLDPPLLGNLFRRMVGEMRLAGELGSLIRVEEGIALELRRAREHLVTEGRADQFLPGFAPEPRQEALNLSGIDDGGFFHEAEERLVDALRAFAERADGGAGVRRRLFADDAKAGIALIDLLRTHFDVVLMNPPFGEATARVAGEAKGDKLPNDLYCWFVARARVWAPRGMVGAITSGSFVLYTDYAAFREHIATTARPTYLVNLGWGVLDAYVSTVAFIIDNDRQQSPFKTCISDIASADEKGASLRESVQRMGRASLEPGIYRHDLSVFRELAGTPFCYWFDSKFLEWARDAKKLGALWSDHGIGAGPHNVFFRLRWELPVQDEGDQSRWPVLSNGGSFSPFFRDNYLHIDWRGTGGHIKAHLDALYPYLKGNVGLKIQREHVYYRPGITYGKRTERFNAQVLPSGAIPSFNGIGAYPQNHEDKWWVLSYLNSRFVAYFLNMTCGLHKNAVYIDRVPVPDLAAEQIDRLSAIGRELWDICRSASETVEISTAFSGPALVRVPGRSLQERMLEWRRIDRAREVRAWALVAELEGIVTASLRLGPAAITAINDDQGPNLWDPTVVGRIRDDGESKAVGKVRPIINRDDEVGMTDLFQCALAEGLAPHAAAERLNADRHVTPGEIESRSVELISWLVGCAFGRWSASAKTEVDDHDSDPSARQRWLPPAARSTRLAPQAFLVSDEGAVKDIVAEVRRAAACVFEDPAIVEQEAMQVLGATNGGLRGWLATSFFKRHIAAYSRARRSAPIYWQLATPSARYSVWMYVHACTSDTLYTLVNDHVRPKLDYEQRKLESMQKEIANHSSAASRRALLDQVSFVEELRVFKDELTRVAPLWRAHLADGVLVRFAPLWRLVPHEKGWQKELRDTWDSLSAGELDWTDLAMDLWPERVVTKCAADRSLAATHRLLDEFWEEAARGRWQPRAAPKRAIAEIVAERTSPAVESALKALREAPIEQRRPAGVRSRQAVR